MVLNTSSQNQAITSLKSSKSQEL